MGGDITFSEHNLGSDCFSARKFKVRYGRLRLEGYPDQLAPAKTKRADISTGGPALGYPAFVGPLSVEWESADGSHFSETLDLNEIFKGRRVLHEEDPAKIDTVRPLATPPNIIVEVNDKTLTLFMDVDIGLKPVEPGGMRGYRRNRLIAFQKTYK